MSDKGPSYLQEKKQTWIFLFLKGMMMGAADIVPGVSGGTIAFITGIYDRLIAALKALEPASIVCLFNQGIAAFWKRIDGNFLLVLSAGILCSIFSLANFIDYGMKYHTIKIWSFFMGLVLASTIVLFQKSTPWHWQQWIGFILGIAIVLILTTLRPAQLPDEWWMAALAGAIAICAMILPGISGSFLLLMLGMYQIIIDAVTTFNLLILLSFACGATTGLMMFSHILAWFLRYHQQNTFSFLIGCLLGSMQVLWPWKQVVETTLDRHGELIPLVQINVFPSTYTQVSGQPFQGVWFFVFALLGVSLVLLLNKTQSTDK